MSNQRGVGLDEQRRGITSAMISTELRNDVSDRFDTLSRGLDRLENELPAIPAKALGLTRATARRVNATASEVAGTISREFSRFGSTASSAVATSVGQTRSAAERTSSTARRTSNEAVGQTKAQVKRTGEAALSSATNLLDDATRAVEPDDGGKPASPDNWSKADLYERAQELDIEGRSTMSKQQLIGAIRNA